MVKIGKGYRLCAHYIAMLPGNIWITTAENKMPHKTDPGPDPTELSWTSPAKTREMVTEHLSICAHALTCTCMSTPIEAKPDYTLEIYNWITCILLSKCVPHLKSNQGADLEEIIFFYVNLSLAFSHTHKHRAEPSICILFISFITKHPPSLSLPKWI